MADDETQDQDAGEPKPDAKTDSGQQEPAAGDDREQDSSAETTK